MGKLKGSSFIYKVNMLARMFAWLCSLSG